jgi:hypothetical protein
MEAGDSMLALRGQLRTFHGHFLPQQLPCSRDNFIRQILTCIFNILDRFLHSCYFCEGKFVALDRDSSIFDMQESILHFKFVE